MGKTERSAPDDTTPLLEPLIALQNLIEHFDSQGVIIGGIAASLLGKPRFTADIDAVILLNIEDLPALIDAAGAQGIELRNVDGEAFARKNRGHRSGRTDRGAVPHRLRFCAGRPRRHGRGSLSWALL